MSTNPQFTSREQLAEFMRPGERVKFLMFWGHQPQQDASIGAGCLSQWWPSDFTIDGTTYATAEHWMMMSKARLFGDNEAATAILVATTPGAAKAAGRAVKGFDEDTWARHRFDLVVQGNIAKFSQNDDLRAYLLQTGSRVLVEASPVDRVWGTGLAADHPDATHPDKWPGLNLLGFALGKTRDTLQSESR
jgi:ribA/ribD-fused uncharacterized protein